MKEQVLAALSPIRVRRRLQRAASWGLAGLFLSAVVCVVLGVVRLSTGSAIPLPAVLGVIAAGPALGGVLGFLWRQPWSRSASAVDAHYRLKDRTVTALEFAESAERTPFHELQLQDATRHLKSVNAREVAPIRVPRHTASAVLTLLLAAALLLYPVAPRVQASPSQPIGIQLAAAAIGEDLKELEELVGEEDSEEFQQMVEELHKELETLADPETDVREALATISEMQAKLAAQMAQYNDALIDAQLQSVGAAMAGAEALQGAAAELQEGDYEEAAKELEALEKAALDRKEARATSEKLAKVSKSMQQAGLGAMSEAVSQMSEGAKSQDSGKLCQACNRLGQTVRKHALRKSLNQLLQSKLTRLSECKSLCRKSGTCTKCGGMCPSASQCTGEGLCLTPGFNPKKSNRSSKKAGAGTSGNIDGTKTDLNSQQNLAAISGQLSGEGESEYETTTSPEGRETARRRTRESFSKYQKMSEAVLESEPIPLGHRQTIRRYFELIRPSSDDALAEDQ